MSLKAWPEASEIALGDVVRGDSDEQLVPVHINNVPAGVLLNLESLDDGLSPWMFLAYRPALADMYDQRIDLDVYQVADAPDALQRELRTASILSHVAWDPDHYVYLPDANLIVGRDELLDETLPRYGWLAGNTDGKGVLHLESQASNRSLETGWWDAMDIHASEVVVDEGEGTLDVTDTLLLPHLAIDNSNNTVQLIPPAQRLNEYVYGRDADDRFRLPWAQGLITDFPSFLAKAHPQAYIQVQRGNKEGGQRIPQATEGLHHTGVPDRLGIWCRNSLNAELHVVVDGGDRHPWAALRGELLDALDAVSGLNSDEILTQTPENSASVLNRTPLAYQRILELVPPVKGSDTAHDLNAVDWLGTGLLQRNTDGVWVWYEAPSLEGSDNRFAYNGWDVALTLNRTLSFMPETGLTSEGIRHILDGAANNNTREFLPAPKIPGTVVREWLFPDQSRAEEVVGPGQGELGGLAADDNRLTMIGADGGVINFWLLEPLDTDTYLEAGPEDDRPPSLRMQVAAERHVLEAAETETDETGSETDGKLMGALGY